MIQQYETEGIFALEQMWEEGALMLPNFGKENFG